jgi:tetratricopeptide (TPR) repeat protein
MPTSIYADTFKRLLQQKAYKAGIDLFSAIVEQIPNDAEGYIYRAQFYARASQLEAALMDVTKALEIDPRSGYAHYVQGDIRRRMDDLRGAVLAYTRAISTGYSEAHNNRGVILMRLGKYRAAFQDFTEAIRKENDSARAYHNRSLLRCQVKDYEGAIRDVTLAITKDANYTRSYLTLGYAAIAAGKTELARNAFCYYLKRVGTLQDDALRWLHQMGGCHDMPLPEMHDTQTVPNPDQRKQRLELPATKPLQPLSESSA